MMKEHILMAGPVAWVLIALSTIALTLLLERLWVHFRYPMAGEHTLNECRRLLQNSPHDAVNNISKKKGSIGRHGMLAAIQAFLENEDLTDEQRQQAASVWLQAEREYLNSRLKSIGLIGTLAPLLGLLGTVFGIISMFISIAHNTGPVTPAVLAEGMWTAMVTTALGLLIAIPSLAASHGLELLSQYRISIIQKTLNEFNEILLGEQDSLGLSEPVPEFSSLHIETAGAA